MICVVYVLAHSTPKEFSISAFLQEKCNLLTCFPLIYTDYGRILETDSLFWETDCNIAMHRVWLDSQIILSVLYFINRLLLESAWESVIL